MTTPNRWYSTEGFRLGRWGARWLPRWLTLRIGEAAGWGTYVLSRTGRHDLQDNFRAVGRSPQEADRLAREAYQRFGGMLADYFVFAAGKLPDPRSVMTQWRGMEHLKQALDRGRGALLVTGHLGHWELGGMLLAKEGIRMNVVTLPEPGTGLTEWREAFRKDLGIQTITVGENKFAFVEIMQALRRNECVAMLVDRPYAASGTPVQLFGRPTQFSTAPALIWEHTGAAVLPAFVLQTSSDKYVPIIEPPVPMQSDGHHRNTQRVAEAFEPVIREHLGQWFNFTPIFESRRDATPGDCLPASLT